MILPKLSHHLLDVSVVTFINKRVHVKLSGEYCKQKVEYDLVIEPDRGIEHGEDSTTLTKVHTNYSKKSYTS